MLNKKVAKALIGWKPVNDCIITEEFQSGHVRATIIHVYTPNEESDDVDKNCLLCVSHIEAYTRRCGHHQIGTLAMKLTISASTNDDMQHFLTGE